MKRRMRHRKHIYPELDITAFMNLMVILVPFLLITAVFSRITVLDLYLPPESNASQSATKQFRLEVVIRSDSIVLREASSGLSKKYKRHESMTDLSGLKRALSDLKERFPSEGEATILAEADVDYDILVQVMDALRMKEIEENGRVRMESLFPVVSIGDAPELKK